MEAIPIAEGKFSKPRANFSQDELLERTFREVSEPPVFKKAAPTPPAPEEIPLSPTALPPEEVLPEMFAELPSEPLIEQEIPVPREQTAYYEDVFEDPVEEESPFLAFFSRNRKVLLICICSVVLVTLLGIIGGIVYVNNADPYDGRILNNVSVGNINLGGLTKEEAAERIEDHFGDVYSTTDMVVSISDTILTFSPEDTGAELDIPALVKDAYSYGRTGTKAEKEAAYQSSLVSVHTIGLLPYLNLDEDYIREVLAEYASGFSSIYSESSYRLEGDMPALECDKFREDAPCQQLVVTIGTPGMGVDILVLFEEILDAYSLCTFRIDKEAASPDMLPALPDLQAIYEELYIAPVDATVDMKTFEPIPGSYGYDFDLEEAMVLLKESDFGETFHVPMRYVEPEVLDSDVLFRDVLGSCQTKHTNNENRNTNLKLACQAINDTVLMPGDTFSFNKCLGERTAEKGYKPAGTYVGNKLVDTIGGGICQISTTLYNCALLGDLEIVDRSNHGQPVTYVDYGLDATVSWGGPDFKFKNNTNFPIKLQASVSGGYVRMEILGTDEKDYYIKMESEITGWEKHETIHEEHDESSGYYDGQVLQGGTDGFYVRSYKCKYDKETDELISRDYEARSHYGKIDKIVVDLIEPETEPEETEPEETEPKETEPKETEPKETEPKETEPKETEPKETEPKETEPKETEPKETEPKQTEPKETEPKETTAAPEEQTSPPETEAQESAQTDPPAGTDSES